MPREQMAHDDNDGAGTYDFDAPEGFNAKEIIIEPQGSWDFVVPAGAITVKAKKPKSDNDKQYPMVVIPIELKRAHQEANESYEGSRLDFMVIAWGRDNVRAGNASKRELAQFCDAIGADIDKFPDEEALKQRSFAVFDDFIAEIENREGKCWTVHETRDGETQARVKFKKPTNAAASSSRRRDEEDEEAPEEEEETVRKPATATTQKKANGTAKKTKR